MHKNQKNDDPNISHTIFTFMQKATGSYRTYLSLVKLQP